MMTLSEILKKPKTDLAVSLFKKNGNSIFRVYDFLKKKYCVCCPLLLYLMPSNSRRSILGCKFASFPSSLLNYSTFQILPMS